MTYVRLNVPDSRPIYIGIDIIIDKLRNIESLNPGYKEKATASYIEYPSCSAT